MPTFSKHVFAEFSFAAMCAAVVLHCYSRNTRRARLSHNSNVAIRVRSIFPPLSCKAILETFRRNVREDCREIGHLAVADSRSRTERLLWHYISWAAVIDA